jgi:hypothetical protein
LTETFVRRCPELLKIEGWYDLPEVSVPPLMSEYNFTLKIRDAYRDPACRVKISCRFHDILRCSEFLQPVNPIDNYKRFRWADKHRHKIHFISCFAQDKGNAPINTIQPILRCRVPNCAIVYLPDKHGNFQARAFIWYKRIVNLGPDNVVVSEENIYEIDKVYGNGLNVDPLIKILMLKFNGLECRYNPSDTYLAEA